MVIWEDSLLLDGVLNAVLDLVRVLPVSFPIVFADDVFAFLL